MDETELERDVAPDSSQRLIVDRPWPPEPGRPSSRPAKADAVRLGRDTTVAEGFEIIVSSCLRHFRLNELLVIESRNVEGLHQARVAMRRLRSALALFRPAVRGQEYRRIKSELSWFTAELGDARNLDVYLTRDLSRDQRQLVEERREEAYGLAIAAMESTRFQRLMLDLAGWAAAGDWRDNSRAAKPIRPFVNRRIDRLWSKIPSDNVSNMGDKRRHRLRISIKKLRYALEFTEVLHPSKPRRRGKFMKAVKEMQGSLGDLHDIVIARSIGTLNSWLLAPGPSSKEEKGMVRDAGRALHRLNKIGPYWG